AAAELLLVRRALDDLLVVDGHRDEEDVIAHALEVRVDLEREQAGLWPEQLAGPAATALDVELLRVAFAQELLHVRAEGRGVDLVALERAAKEERAAPTEQRSE